MASIEKRPGKGKKISYRVRWRLGGTSDGAWSYDFGEQAHVVELYINYLRRKIEADRSPLIRTVDGAGFTLEA